MISKELYEIVCPNDEDPNAAITEFKMTGNDLYVDYDVEEYNCAKFVNIHELAHLCKEWAYNNNRVVSSCITNNEKGSIWYCTIANLNRDNPINNCDYYENTEPKAIFAACEWILKSTNEHL